VWEDCPIRRSHQIIDEKMKFLLKFVVGAVIGCTAAMCFGQTASFSIQPIADAFVTSGASGSLSSSNFGAAGSLAIGASGLPQGEFQSVLKFNLSAAESSFNAQFGSGQWAIQSVTLQLTSSPHNNAIFNNISPGQFGVSLMQNNLWVEGTGTGGAPGSDGVSFNSLLSTYLNNTTDQSLGTFTFPGGSSGQNGYNLSLSSGMLGDVTSGSDLSLRLFAADSSVSYLFTSRSGSSGQPDILVQAAAVPEPNTMALCGMALVLFCFVQVARQRKARKTQR
jgi:hypothetical protein